MIVDEHANMCIQMHIHNWGAERPQWHGFWKKRWRVGFGDGLQQAATHTRYEMNTQTYSCTCMGCLWSSSRICFLTAGWRFFFLVTWVWWLHFLPVRSTDGKYRNIKKYLDNPPPKPPDLPDGWIVVVILSDGCSVVVFPGVSLVVIILIERCYLEVLVPSTILVAAVSTKCTAMPGERWHILD